MHTVSGKELWALVIDMKMQGNMTREMFIRSLKYLTIGLINLTYSSENELNDHFRQVEMAKMKIEWTTNRWSSW